MGLLPLDREHRPDLLLVRLGVAPAGDGLSRDLPRAGHDDAAVQPHRPDALAALSRGVRRGAHQDARRPVLARPHLPLLPPRDATDAQPAQLVLPSPAETVAPRRGARKSLCPADRALVPFLPATDRDHGW